MATPCPKPVEPSCSRSLRLASTAADSIPTRWPATSASCFSSERLLPPGKDGLIASQSRNSASCMVVLVSGCDRSHPGRRDKGSVDVRLNPADISVLAPVDHVECARRTVLEHEGRGVPEVHQHHGVRYTRFRDIDPRLSDDGREA